MSLVAAGVAKVAKETGLYADLVATFCYQGRGVPSSSRCSLMLSTPQSIGTGGSRYHPDHEN